jgi:hypothetical protein
LGHRDQNRTQKNQQCIALKQIHAVRFNSKITLSTHDGDI